jgi:cysteine desulfurase
MTRAWETGWANPASVHGPGRAARALVEDAREAVAQLLGFDARDVVFTSGGTEANNVSLFHAFRDAVPDTSRPPALVVSLLEHPSVVRAAEQLASRGVWVEWVTPAPSGRMDPSAIAAALSSLAGRTDVRLVALQAVNHETGVLQPVAEVAELVHAAGALLHVDAVQAVGRCSPELWHGADLVTIASHKIRGPKGVGAVATIPGIRLRPLVVGGAQERGLRGGTQDAAALSGFGVAARRAEGGPTRYAALAPLRDHFESKLFALGADLGIPPLRNGDAPRASHVFNLSWPGLRGDELCAALDLEGVAISSGSACSAGTSEPPAVVRAMVGEARARAAVRVSLGEETTAEEVEEALRRWRRVLGREGRTRGGRH